MPDDEDSIQLDDIKGVKFNPPPPSLRDAVDANIMQTIGQLRPDSKSALIGVVQRVNGKQSANAAFVYRVDDTWIIGAYVGKTWGEPINAGGIVRAEW